MTLLHWLHPIQIPQRSPVRVLPLALSTPDGMIEFDMGDRRAPYTGEPQSASYINDGITVVLDRRPTRTYSLGPRPLERLPFKFDFSMSSDTDAAAAVVDEFYSMYVAYILMPLATVNAC